jgi:hypothetical protein
MADAFPRLFESDLTPVKQKVSFNGNYYNMHVQVTAFGGMPVQATDFLSLLTENTISRKLEHLYKLVDRCPELYHGHKPLRENIQVLDSNNEI